MCGIPSWPRVSRLKFSLGRFSTDPQSAAESLRADRKHRYLLHVLHGSHQGKQHGVFFPPLHFSTCCVFFSTLSFIASPRCQPQRPPGGCGSLPRSRHARKVFFFLPNVNVTRVRPGESPTFVAAVAFDAFFLPSPKTSKVRAGRARLGTARRGSSPNGESALVQSRTSETNSARPKLSEKNLIFICLSDTTPVRRVNWTRKTFIFYFFINTTKHRTRAPVPGHAGAGL